MKHQKSKAPSQRQLRVGEQIRHIIAGVLQRGDLHHETLRDAPMITVTEVRTSPDLKNATAYVITPGGEQIEDILPALNESAREFQHEIARQATLKFTPRLHFKADNSFAQAEKIETILRDIHYAEDRGMDDR